MSILSEFDRDEMIRQLQQRRSGDPESGGGVAPPYVPPEENNPSRPETSSSSSSSSRKSLQDILGGYAYGAKGLADAEGELRDAGYQLQRDSQGRVRGRLKAAGGDIIDVIGQGEGNDWWNNQT